MPFASAMMRTTFIQGARKGSSGMTRMRSAGMTYLIAIQTSSDLARGRSAEEPLRAHQQHGQHDQVGYENLQLGHQVDCEAAAEADQQSGDGGAFDLAEAGRGNHGKGEHDHVGADGGEDGGSRRG